ncbi:MAG: hypothetical protein O3C26_04255 [Actinomycetota bacterium]|nr:hypothetical protein [Actinomycetota bacterium]
MGVYVFESKHAPFVKVGHFKGQNAWRRIAPKRGFNSTDHPVPLNGKLAPTDFQLRFWFPHLDFRDEKFIHSQLDHLRVIGEWYELPALRRIERLVKDENYAHLCDFEEAMAYKRSMKSLQNPENSNEGRVKRKS